MDDFPDLADNCCYKRCKSHADMMFDGIGLCDRCYEKIIKDNLKNVGDKITRDIVIKNCKPSIRKYINDLY